MKQETIFALSSGSLPSGVAVIRISGPEAFDVCPALGCDVPSHRQTSVKTIRTRNGLILDRALMIAFHAPASFTGENCLEIHAHGGRAVVSAILEELRTLPKLRMAAPGEFTRQAFANGKMDLLEVEGLADLIGAETEMQRRLAVEQSSGGLSHLYMAWAERLTHARAMIEAELDFADEDDIPGSVADTIWSDMRRLETDMASHLAMSTSGEIIRDGLKVVIAGPPNTGKSSLLNALARRDVAIVTNIAGTTRDVLQVDLDIGGYAVKLHDTAGLRDTDEPVEREGIRRAVDAMEQADMIIVLDEIGAEPRFDVDTNHRAKVLRVATKLDLCGYCPKEQFDVAISTVTGAGIADLIGLIQAFLREHVSGSSLSLPTRQRHAEHLRNALNALKNANELQGQGLEIRADALRESALALGRITGRIDVEDLLGRIFSEFCVGK